MQIITTFSVHCIDPARFNLFSVKMGAPGLDYAETHAELGLYIMQMW